MADKYLRVGQDTHAALQKSLAKHIGKTGTVISLREWTEKVIGAGIKALTKRKK